MTGYKRKVTFYFHINLLESLKYFRTEKKMISLMHSDLFSFSLDGKRNKKIKPGPMLPDSYRDRAGQRT